jgi:hypothetical protein
MRTHSKLPSVIVMVRATSLLVLVACSAARPEPAAPPPGAANFHPKPADRLGDPGSPATMPTPARPQPPGETVTAPPTPAPAPLPPAPEGGPPTTPPPMAVPPAPAPVTPPPAPIAQPMPPPSPTTPAAVCGSGPGRLGPPSAEELMRVSQQAKAAPHVPSGNNKGNHFAYGNGAKALGNVRSLYALTGDGYFLDEAIKIADHILSVRNDKDATTGRVLWTGKREPCWPNNDDPTCGAESGAVANQLLSVAKIIVAQKAIWEQAVGGGDPRGYGATYMQRARTYLREAILTMDYFFAYYVDRARANRIAWPTDPAFVALGDWYVKSQGRTLPWNQQDMVTGPLSTIGDILLTLGEDGERVASYDVVVQASMDAFIKELETNKYMVNGVTVYRWGYSPGDLYHVEDTAHSSADINALYNAYRRGRYGIKRETMVPMASTFLEVIARPDGTYASHVDFKGGTTRPSISGSWMNYEEFRPGIVARLLPRLTTDASTSLADGVSILSQRKRLCP